MNIKLIDVPLCVGSPTTGSDLAGKTLSREINKNHNFEIVKIENLNERTNSPENMKNLESVIDASKKLRDEVFQTLLSNQFPLILGGDHSLSIGSLSATSEIYDKDDLLVVWIDAHTDINTEETSESGNIHGMPVAISLGIANSKLSFNGNKQMLNGNNVFNISGRSIDKLEYENIKKTGITVYDHNLIKEKGLNFILNDLKSKTNATKVHISFDVDSLDPSVFTSSGYVLNNGLTDNDVIKIIEFLTNNYEPVLFECVEYNPDLDTDKSDLKVLIKIIDKVIEIVNKKY